MGILDSVFSGESGIVSLLHQQLGGKAILRIVSSTEIDKDTHRIKPKEYTDFEVSFVPDANSDAQTNLSNNAVSMARTISGTIPASEITIRPLVGRDFLVVNAENYRIESVDALRVGDEVVQYSISGKRV